MSELPSLALEVGAPVPSNVADCADFYNEVRALRLEIESRAEEIKKRENELKEHIIASLVAAKVQGVTGKVVQVSLKTKHTARLEKNGWDRFAAWVVATGRTEFLYKRVLESACKDAAENGGELPQGVEFVDTADLSLKMAR